MPFQNCLRRVKNIVFLMLNKDSKKRVVLKKISNFAWFLSVGRTQRLVATL